MTKPTNPIDAYLIRHPDVKPKDRAKVRECAAKMIRYYRLSDKDKEQIPIADRNDTSMIKFYIREQTTLNQEQRLELALLLDCLAYRAGRGQIAEDIIL